MFLSNVCLHDLFLMYSQVYMTAASSCVSLRFLEVWRNVKLREVPSMVAISSLRLCSLSQHIVSLRENGSRLGVEEKGMIGLIEMMIEAFLSPWLPCSWIWTVDLQDIDIISPIYNPNPIRIPLFWKIIPELPEEHPDTSCRGDYHPAVFECDLDGRRVAWQPPVGKG